jgi:hypothetical protein
MTMGIERPEAGAKIEMTMQELVARQTVLETVQTQLMIKMAGVLDQPQEFVRAVMADAEENLSRARKKAPEEHHATADMALAYFVNYSTA